MVNRIVTDQVSEDRWRAAQDWEQQHWIGAQKARAQFGKNFVWRFLSLFGAVPKFRGDDWNSWWQKEFDNYTFLPKRVENAIEVGCGPYTNIRLIQPVCRFDHLVLSDPLIRTYVKFKLTFVAEMYRSAFCVLDDHPLEKLPFADNHFDLLVIINVLDHVKDAHACMRNLIRVIRPGGWLIFGQDLSNDEDLAALKADGGAVGHPIKLDAQWFEPYFKTGWKPHIDKVLPREQGRAPGAHYATRLFAATKN